MSEDLAPTWVIGSIDLTEYPFSVDRDNTVDIGEPDMIVESLTSQLADGDIERTVRHGNRTYVLPIYIEGPTLADVADAEALLRAELRSSGLTLTHNPGDSWAVDSVYEVQTARMSPSRDDTHESHLIRKWTLTLTCAPFARSAGLTTVETLPVPVSPTTTTFDTCDSATGWTATVNGAAVAVDLAWEAGSVSVKETLAPGPQTLTLTRTGAVDFTPTRYLVADIGYYSSLGALPVTCVADGSVLPLLEQRLIAPGSYRYTYDSGGVDAASLTFSSYTEPDYADLKIRSLVRTDMPPAITPRQLLRTLEVGGTERTAGSLKISAPDGTSALQLVLVSSWPENGSGFAPPLRRWRVGGNTETPNAGTFSGKAEPLGPAYSYFDVPIASLPPGTYQLMALMRASVAGSYNVESVIQSRHNGVTLGETTWGTGGTETVSFPFANDWKLVPMGVYGAPIVAAKAGEFRILIKTPGTTVVDYDEAWLFPVDDDCALSAILTPEPHLWLDSPDLTSRVPKTWEGEEADKSDGHWPVNGIHTMGSHVFTPGRTSVFTAGFGVDYPEVELTYHKRWHSNAAED